MVCHISAVLLVLLTAIVVGCSPEPSASAAPGPVAVVATPSPDAIPVPTRQAGEFTTLVAATRAPQNLTVVAKPTALAPTIDGDGTDDVWQFASPVQTVDFASQRPIELRAMYHAGRLYMRIQFPDHAPSETHKTWVWDAQEDVYLQGLDREDAFCLKWSMVGNDVDLSFRRAQPHQADVWFWKARRTNPSGYFDDKHHNCTAEPRQGALAVSTSSGETLYLTRHGDSGRSAYESRIVSDYVGEAVPKYYPRTPDGSRADVTGRGRWLDGTWTLELSRSLDTGHQDDVPFRVGSEYLFAVCCYEMDPSGIVQSWTQPLYRSGDAFDRLRLRIDPGPQ